jgi:hypothetical protein
VIVKFGIKALSMLSCVALALVALSGCTEDTPPPAANTAPTTISKPGPASDKGPGAAAPAPTKPDEKK